MKENNFNLVKHLVESKPLNGFEHLTRAANERSPSIIEILKLATSQMMMIPTQMLKDNIGKLAGFDRFFLETSIYPLLNKTDEYSRLICKELIKILLNVTTIDSSVRRDATTLLEKINFILPERGKKVEAYRTVFKTTLIQAIKNGKEALLLKNIMAVKPKDTNPKDLIDCLIMFMQKTEGPIKTKALDYYNKIAFEKEIKAAENFLNTQETEAEIKSEAEIKVEIEPSQMSSDIPAEAPKEKFILNPLQNPFVPKVQSTFNPKAPAFELKEKSTLNPAVNSFEPKEKTVLNPEVKPFEPHVETLTPILDSIEIHPDVVPSFITNHAKKLEKFSGGHPVFLAGGSVPKLARLTEAHKKGEKIDVYYSPQNGIYNSKKLVKKGDLRNIIFNDFDLRMFGCNLISLAADLRDKTKWPEVVDVEVFPNATHPIVRFNLRHGNNLIKIEISIYEKNENETYVEHLLKKTNETADGSISAYIFNLIDGKNLMIGSPKSIKAYKDKAFTIINDKGINKVFEDDVRCILRHVLKKIDFPDFKNDEELDSHLNLNFLKPCFHQLIHKKKQQKQLATFLIENVLSRFTVALTIRLFDEHHSTFEAMTDVSYKDYWRHMYLLVNTESRVDATMRPLNFSVFILTLYCAKLALLYDDKATAVDQLSNWHFYNTLYLIARDKNNPDQNKAYLETIESDIFETKKRLDDTLPPEKKLEQLIYLVLNKHSKAIFKKSKSLNGVLRIEPKVEQESKKNPSVKNYQGQRLFSSTKIQIAVPDPKDPIRIMPPTHLVKPQIPQMGKRGISGSSQ